MPSDTDNLLDIIPAAMLLQPYLKKHKSEIYVVGLADGKDEAFMVVRDIIDDVYSNTGAFDIRGYLRFGTKMY